MLKQNNVKNGYNVGEPLYVQVSSQIRLEILKGIYKHALPGERQLVQIYNVSRITIRQAIDELVKEGILFKVHGKGTFICPERADHPLASLRGVIEELSESGVEYETKVDSIRQTVPGKRITLALQLEPETKVWEICRIIYTESLPYLINYTYLNIHDEEEFKKLDFQSNLYQQLELLGRAVKCGEMWISAEAANESDSQKLGISPLSPVLVAESLTMDANGTPVDYCIARYRPDRYKYHINTIR